MRHSLYVCEIKSKDRKVKPPVQGQESTTQRLGYLLANIFPVLTGHYIVAIFLHRFTATTRAKHAGANMATHMVKVREDLLQKLITLSQETGKPVGDLIEEILDWVRQESLLRRSRAA